MTGRKPKLSTTGGTSDARFIKDYCPVLEFGLVGQTMHAVDECTPVTDLVTLTAVYRRIIEKYFGTRGGNDLLSRGDAGVLTAMRGGKVVRRTRLAGKEQAVVDRLGKRLPAIGETRQSKRIGPERKRIAPPADACGSA